MQDDGIEDSSFMRTTVAAARPSLMDRSSVYSQHQCPHCLRNFSKQAAARHIPVCQHIQAKPKML